MTTTKFGLRYMTNVGFSSDQGGRAFQKPSCIVRRSDGRIFIGSRGPAADQTVGIQMVSLDHDFFGVIGKLGRSDGQMMEPSALALDAEDNLYLADEKLHKVSIFNRDGEFIKSWGEQGTGPGQFEGPCGLLMQGDTIFVVDARNHRIQKLTKDGIFISEWGSFGTNDGDFRFPWGISSDQDGNIFIADWGNDRIQKLTPDGLHLNTYGKTGSGEGELSRPADVAVDQDGNLYIADWGNQRLQVIDSEGNFLAASRGEAIQPNPWVVEYFTGVLDEKAARDTFVPIFDVDTQDEHEISARIEPYFWDPCSVILDEQNRVYVLETCRHRFQVFERI